MWSSSLFLLLEVLKVFPCAVVVCYNGSDGCFHGCRRGSCRVQVPTRLAGYMNLEKNVHGHVVKELETCVQFDFEFAFFCFWVVVIAGCST
jgi:hypothetical protein